MPSQIYGSKIFVGREKEIAEFEQVLNSPEASQWILNVHGPGGIGKTQLLNKFVEIVEHRRAKGVSLLVTKEFIDLYWTENRRTLGMLKNIADQLVPELFTDFYYELEKYNALLSRQVLSDQPLLLEQEKRARSTFFEIYKSLPVQRIILIFDTTELAAETAFDLWQSFSFLIENSDHKTLLVLAGRRKLDIFTEEDCKWLPVIGLSVNQVKSYFDSTGIDLSLGIVEKVAELSQGRPIMIALTVDWLRFGRLPDNLMNYTPEQFERAMIERIQQLQFPEDQIILAMAHFYRRFDEQLLSYVLENILRRSSADVMQQTESLAKYSFIKYRPPSGGKSSICTLHDEMRDLVVKYVWKTLDPREEERREWSSVILTFYADKIDHEQDQSECQDLSLERLFYWCAVDIHQAFNYSRQLAEDALYRFDFRYIDAINIELEHQENLLSSGEKKELALRRAVVLHQEGKTEDAKQIINSLSGNLPREPVLLLAWLIEFHADSGNPRKAIEINIEYGLEQELKKNIDRVLGEEQKPFKRALGTLYNNLGYAASHQGHMNAAVEYYEKALDHFLKTGEAYAQIARTRNNLGFVLHRLGRAEEALSHCETAFKLRQCLPNSFEVGLSYNVIGQIYADLLRVDEAINYFEKAIQAFELADSDRGKALVYTAYGCLLRQLGWYREDFAKEPFNPNRKEYQKACTMLDDAIEIFRKLLDLSHLCEALNEKGSLLRQQKKWEEALASYEESKVVAEKIENSYRETDNLQDMGILYEFRGNEVLNDPDKKKEYARKAMGYAQKASDLAWKDESFYLYARAQRTMGEALFNLGEYEKAFKCAAEACMYVVRPDPSGSMHSSAKTNLVYDKFENWTSDLILRLPTHELARTMCDFLIDKWMQNKQNEKRLAELYPAFISKMRSLKIDYPLLRVAGKKD